MGCLGLFAPAMAFGDDSRQVCCGMRVKEFTLARQTFVVTLVVRNPNDRPLPITAMSYRIQIEGSEAAQGASVLDRQAPAFPLFRPGGPKPTPVADSHAMSISAGGATWMMYGAGRHIGDQGQGKITVAGSKDQPGLQIEGVVVGCPARRPIEAAVRDVLQRKLRVEPCPQGRPPLFVVGQPIELEGHPTAVGGAGIGPVVGRVRFAAKIRIARRKTPRLVVKVADVAVEGTEVVGLVGCCP